MTCQHKPFLANNGQVTAAWDSCMGPGLKTTIDAGKGAGAVHDQAALLALLAMQYRPCGPP
jgi:hypothetical protein